MVVRKYLREEMVMAEDRNAAPGSSGDGKAASGESTPGSTVASVASSVRDTASSAMNQAQEAVGQASEAAWQSTRDVGSRAGDIAGQAYDYGRRTVSSVGAPGASPMAYVAIGAALVFSLWYLLNGNRDSGSRHRN
jgi:hypothetical protein